MTATSTSTMIPSPTASWTPLPTLPSVEALTYVINQLGSDCTLPCWWEIIPGETLWSGAEQDLRSYANRIVVTGTPFHFKAEVYLEVPEDVSPIPIKHVYSVDEGKISMIHADLGFFVNYKPTYILQEYGVPDEIRILTVSTARSTRHPFAIAMFYNVHQFLVSYSYSAHLNGNEVIVCPSEESTTQLLMWASDLSLEFDVLLAELGGENANDFELLEDVTNLDAGEFHDIFSSSDSQECFETQAHFWPPQ